MKRLLQIFGGCGVAVAVIIALVAWLLTGHGTSQEPVPENIPPVEGKEVAHIDVNAPGRTADKLTYWASDLAEQTGIPPAALRAYGNAELIAQQKWPNCHLPVSYTHLTLPTKRIV